MTSKTSSSFDSLITFMDNNQIQYTLKKATTEAPFDAILIGIGVEDEKSAAALQIHHYVEELTIPEEIRKEKNILEESLGMLHILNFILIHNAILEQDIASDISRFLPFANRSVPFGTLAYSEIDQRCYYQFSYPSTTEEIQPATFQSIFNTIFFVKELFFTGITEIVNGTATVDQIMQEIV
ncbi:MAG: hypothetical protein QRY74_05855 [Chlamydia sp.]